MALSELIVEFPQRRTELQRARTALRKKTVIAVRVEGLPCQTLNRIIKP